MNRMVKTIFACMPTVCRGSVYADQCKVSVGGQKRRSATKDDRESFYCWADFTLAALAAWR